MLSCSLVLACGPAAAQQANALFARAFDLLQKGEIEVAITMFQEGLRQDPGNGLAHLHLGNALMARRPPEEATAVTHYRRAAELMPGTPDGIEAMARLKALQDRAAQAQAAVQELIGTWELSQRCSWGSTADKFRIAGLAPDGRATIADWEGRGSIEEFRVSGPRVSFTLLIQFLGTNTASFRGRVAGPGQMSGTYTQTTNPEICRWIARKTG